MDKDIKTTTGIFSSNFEPKLMEPNQNHKRSKGRQSSMEEDLKILKVEYLNTHWPDFPQILNLSLGDHPKIKDDLHWKMTSNY